MRERHRPAAQIDRRRKELSDLEIAKADTGPDNVHNGVNRADLVKMNLIERGVVCLRLGSAQSTEDEHGPFPDLVAQRARLNQTLNLREAAMVVVVMMMIMPVMARLLRQYHLEVRSPQTFPHDRFGTQFVPRQIQLLKLGTEVIEREAHVEECTQNHVSRDAVKGVEK